MLATAVACAIARPPEARAFCGFYVGKADSNLFNHASQVVMVRHGDKSVLSLMNDYQGEPSDFALVVPVPEVLQKEQIHIGDREIFKKLDQYSSPRLVEYFDPDPCEVIRPMAESDAVGRGIGGGFGGFIGELKRRSHGRDGRGAIHRRRIRHRDPVGQAVRWPGNLAAGKRLQDSARSASRARTLHPPEHEVLRREGEPQGASGDRAQLSAPDPVRLRIAEVHAADSPRHD